MKLTHLILATSTVALLTACGGGDSVEIVQNGNDTQTSAPEMGKDIRVVGSSTVYPFSTKVAQEFKNKTGYNVVVESTGSGGGHKLFCTDVGVGTPDITNSSRRQKKTEYDNCVKNDVGPVVEVKIGYDGIVMSNAIDSPSMNMNLDDIFYAFAKQVPTSATDCTLIPNPNMTWDQIDASLPDFKIEAYGPPPTSGTRDAFIEIAMEGGAKQIECLADLSKTDKTAFVNVAHTLREDGLWIDAGENDNALVQTLVNTPTAVGVFGYSFLDQNADKIKGAEIDGISPTFENIAGGEYDIARSLYFYLKAGNLDTTPGLKEFALEFISDAASGPGGYLEEIGLVPLPDDQRAKVRSDVENMTGYSQ